MATPTVNWYDVLLRAAQEDELDPADIPTVLHWRGRAMRVDEFLASKLNGGRKSEPAEIMLEFMRTAEELNRTFVAGLGKQINAQTVDRQISKLQVLLYTITMRLDLDLDLSVLHHLKEMEKYLAKNQGYPYSD